MKTKPNPFESMISSCETVFSQGGPRSPAALELGKQLDSQLLIEQLRLVQYFKEVVEARTPESDAAASRLLRTFALIERTRERLSKPCKGDPDYVESLSQDRLEARNFLTGLLIYKDIPATDLFKRARAVGISPRTLRRAKADISAIAYQRSDEWYWALPVEVTRAWEAADAAEAAAIAAEFASRKAKTETSQAPDAETSTQKAPTESAESNPNANPDPSRDSSPAPTAEPDSHTSITAAVADPAHHQPAPEQTATAQPDTHQSATEPEISPDTQVPESSPLRQNLRWPDVQPLGGHLRKPTPSEKAQDPPRGVTPA